MRHPFLTFATAIALLAPFGLGVPGVLAADVDAAGVTAPGSAARVIVRFKADASTLRRTLALPPKPSAAQAAAVHAERARALGDRIGRTLTAGLGVDDRTQVVTASAITSQQLVDQLVRDGDVEYAVIDERRRVYAAPNDPYYLNGPPQSASSGGPAVGQWYLRAPDASVRSSIDAEGAWAETTGSSNIVVAVLDTGLRFDHADLQAGNVLPGYDFVTSTFVSNDGDGRDADASDPGDWVTAADVASAANTVGCKASDVTNVSSWHGTQTLGLVGAATDNRIGIASVGRGVRVMPVRVLGKCGGFDSDITAAMRWAAGLSVPGVPANPTPARVINLSLGGSGSCTSAYSQAIAEVNAAGAVVVASAGNSEGHAVSSPANCAGVIAVAGLRHVGTKVGFSDLGPEITIAAPGGNCINTASGSPCLYPILTLANAGSTTPASNAAGGSIYTDAFRASLGTSFSAPLVSGTVALMLSVQPALTPAQVKSTLQSTALAFPTTGGDNGDGSVVPVCTAPRFDASGNAVNQDQCYCTTSTCGAGMLNAGAAVRALVMAGTARISQSPAIAVIGQPVTLSGADSTASPGRTVASYRWSLVDGGGAVGAADFGAGGVSAAQISFVPSGVGAAVVRLSVADSAGGVVETTRTVNVVAQGTAVITQSPADVAVVGQTLTVSAASSSAISGRTFSSYLWRLVDGGGAVSGFSSALTGVTATLVPAASGTAQVGLTLTDNAGTTLNATRSITVVAAGVARITPSTSAAQAGVPLSLSAAGSTVPAGRTIAGYQWRIVDSGGAVTGFTSSATADIVTLTPGGAGTATVGLTVIDSAGQSTVGTLTFAVSAAAVPSVARITQSPTNPAAGQVVTLDGTGSTAASGRSITAFQWRIVSSGGIVSGFGSSATASSVSLTPTAAGSVTVGLTVTDSSGATSDTTRVIDVAAATVVTPPPTSSGGGGGALGLPWLLLLAAAGVAARRVRTPR